VLVLTAVAAFLILRRVRYEEGAVDLALAAG